MLACIAIISPLHRLTGERADVRVSSINDAVNGPKVNGLGGRTWEPAMVNAPVLGMTVWNGDFSDAVSVANAGLLINMRTLKETFPFADDCAWIGAPVTIFAEKPGTAWPWRQRFVGKVSGFGVKGDTLTLGCQVDTEPFNADVLVSTYAGTGNAEGGADLKGQVKPLIIGRESNVQPVLINAADSVYQFSGYGAIEAVTTLYERGASFGASIGDYASYAALVGASIPAGRWATCLAEGLIRLGAPEFGVITGDVRGHVVAGASPRLTGAIVSVLADLAGIDAAALNVAALDLLDADKPYPVNVVLTEQTKFIDIARQMALCCNYQSGVGFDGRFTVIKIGFDQDEGMTFDARGRSWPQVREAEELDVSPPFWKVVMGAARCWRVHSTEEIAFAANLIERGRYDAAESYREGHIVDLANGSRWIYVNPVASTGNAPPAWPTASNAYWENLNPPTYAEDIEFDDGQTVQELKPAEEASDVTSAISGVADITINADYAGAVTTALPKTQAYVLSRNGVDVTTEAVWSVTVLGGVMSASIGAATGVLSINASGGTLTSGTVRITATRDGKTRTMDVKVTKVLASAPVGGGTGGTSASSGFSGDTTIATMVAVSAELTITIGSVGEADLAANYSFDVFNDGSYHVYARWYWWNGTAYVAIGSEVQSDVPATYIAADLSGEPGYGGCNFTDTGLTPASSQKYRLFMRNVSGTVQRTITGTVSAVGS